MKKKSLNILLSITFGLVILLLSASRSYAADPIIADPQCEGKAIGACDGNFKCVISGYELNADGVMAPVVTRTEQPNCNSSEIGGVAPPKAILSLNDRTRFSGTGSEGESIGIIMFISNLIRVFAIVAGIWAMFNLLMGGYTLITSMSDAGAMEKVKNNITMTVVGLAIIAGAYIIAAVIGAVMFGDPNFILRPQLQGALQGTTAP